MRTKVTTLRNASWHSRERNSVKEIVSSNGARMLREDNAAAEAVGRSIDLHQRANARWYVVQTHTHQETLAERNLLRQNYQTYLPKRIRTIRHARRITTVSSAYFDSYLFVSLDVNHHGWYAIRSTIGVRRLLMAHGAPLPTPHGVVEALILATDENGTLRPSDMFHPGQRVKIAAGAFAEQLGVLAKVGRLGAVEVLLEIMNRSVAVHIDRDQLHIV